LHLIIYYLIAFLWAIFTGFMFSSTGAAGGILASFGFITILGVQDANSIKVMSEILVLISPIVILHFYLKQKRFKKLKKILFLVGSTLGLGGLLGASLGSWISKSYLSDLKSFKYFFGYIAFMVVILMVYKMIKQKHNNKNGKSKKLNVDEFSSLKDGEMSKFSFKTINVKIDGEVYPIHPIFIFIAGFLIAILAAMFGVGGGFLFVPFLTDIVGFQVFFAAAISILSVLIIAAVSVSVYLSMGVHVIVPLLAVSLVGILTGSAIGPKLSRHVPNDWLRYAVIALLLFIGIAYVF